MHLLTRLPPFWGRFLVWGLLGAALLLLGACASGGQIRERDYFPGNSPYYNFGIAQSKENFANVKQAQAADGPPTKERTWSNFGATIAPGTVIGLQQYLPFSMRWELKDGRQFIVDDINVSAIMKDYFKDKNNDITLPWQREGRRRTVDDYDPALVFEVRDDVARIKWLITDIRTPIDKRYSSTGARLLWDLERKEYLVVEIKGKPTQSINFNIKREIRNNIGGGQ